MAPPAFSRPDNVLKRAEDLIGVNQSDAALQTLYELITSKRTRSFSPAELEPVAILFVTLAVELRNAKLVKDGLHQYKKNVQAGSTGLPSVEVVVKKFIELSEAQLSAAQEKADAVAVTEDDLEAVEPSPEDILLSSVSTDDTRDRSDRELVNPSLRFLWEAYRTVLDILRNNSKLEQTYAFVVSQAFQFCLKYNRKTEFRRLCDFLRAHILAAAQKTPGHQAVNPIDLSDPDTLQRHLEMRFQQLNVSVKLELWQESFRTVEDVHTLLISSKRQPRPSMMVNYYENMAKIFAVSNNSLFRAAAWQKFFNLYSQSPLATDKDLKHYASVYLLSTLAIPQDSRVTTANDDFGRRKKARLASLLNLSKVPTRESLIESVLSKKLLKIVDPSLARFYDLIEADFHPLSFATKSKAIFAEIESNKDFASYIRPLTEVILTRLFEQVSQVYESIKLDFLVRLSTFEGAFKLTPSEIETLLIEAGQKNLLAVKINHDAKVVSFRSDPFEDASTVSDLTITKQLQPSPAELIRHQLSTLAKSLTESLRILDPTISESEKENRAEALQKANAEFENERAEIVSRYEIVDARKEKRSEENRRKEEEQARARLEKLAAERKAEQERMEQEAERRRLEKLEREKQEITEREKRKAVEEINAKGIIKVDLDDLDNIDPDRLKGMQLQQLEKERKEMEEKLKSTARKFDHIERAQRKFELSLLEKDSEIQKVKDLEDYEAMKSKLLAQAKKDHDESLKLRDRLKRTVPDYTSFVSKIREEKSATLIKLREDARKNLEAAKAERVQQIISERKARAEAEKREREEAERRAEFERKEAERINEERERARVEEEQKAEKARANLSFSEIQRLKREQQFREPSGGRDFEAPPRKGSGLPPPSEFSAPPRRQFEPVSQPSYGAPAPASDKPMSFAEKMRLKRMQGGR
ncbi:unnamed protein product [Kuraishia capsulata CBS 1993]|uniref:Eukaryotic translation initiation factor 3 subunit A n=1 Tax=Kuraishia capsulata CBS 1993 TaxID=1382522 RepID=W6MF96_9ASCO|nr:uncharacterized protein KUCA_T00000361001 [Kuraishia capsulata CBS 1993]CDK24399.1 unnamed protein product [Kuraishia capsulata CBS 1993]